MYYDTCKDRQPKEMYDYFKTLCYYTTERFNYLCLGAEYRFLKELKYDILVIEEILQGDSDVFITISYKHKQGSHIFGYAKFGDDIYRVESSLDSFKEYADVRDYEEVIDELDEIEYSYEITGYTAVKIPDIEIAKRNFEIAKKKLLTIQQKAIREILLGPKM